VTDQQTQPGESYIGVEQRQVNDCLVACLATVLEMPYEDVPADIAYDGESGQRQAHALRRFLLGRGLIEWKFTLHGHERPLVKFGNAKPEWHLWPQGYWLAVVESPRTGDGHVVVMHGDKIAWDPHPGRAEGHRGFRQAMILMVRGPE
jgi:hypothetical protein